MRSTEETTDKLASELADLRRWPAEFEVVGTERSRTMEALQASEERFRNLVESMDDWVWEVDASLVYTYASPRVKELLGYRPEEIIGRTPMDLMVPEEAERTAGQFQAHVQLQEPIIRLENTNLRKDGRLVVLETSGVPFFDADGRLCGYRGISCDITERKQAEEALRASDEKYRAIFDEARDGIVLIDAETGLITDCNREFERQAARTVVELRKMHIWELRPPDQVKAFREEFFDVRETGLGESSELALRRPDGEEIAVDLLATRVNVFRGKAYIQSSYRDITERKKLEEQMQRSQLLASLGEMTAGIAHEVNNPLASILLYSELAGNAEALAPAKKDNRVIRGEAKRASGIMKDLLAYSRKAEPIRRRIDIHRSLRKVINMRRYQEQVRNIDVDVKMAGDPLRVRGNAAHLTQLFMNLIVNAEEALENTDDKRILVTTEADNKSVRISIADSGAGIPEENLSKVFVPFFSTKPTGRGTGLGLATCHGIVTAHGGLIGAENNDMGGATFVVELPLAGKAK